MVACRPPWPPPGSPRNRVRFTLPRAVASFPATGACPAPVRRAPAAAVRPRTRPVPDARRHHRGRREVRYEIGLAPERADPNRRMEPFQRFVVVRGRCAAGISPMANAPGYAGVPPAGSFSRALRPFRCRRDAGVPGGGVPGDGVPRYDPRTARRGVKCADPPREPSRIRGMRPSPWGEKTRPPRSPFYINALKTAHGARDSGPSGRHVSRSRAAARLASSCAGWERRTCGRCRTRSAPIFTPCRAGRGRSRVRISRAHNLWFMSPFMSFRSSSAAARIPW